MPRDDETSTGRDMLKPLENAPMPRTMEPQRRDLAVKPEDRQQRLPTRPEKPG